MHLTTEISLNPIDQERKDPRIYDPHVWIDMGAQYKGDLI